MKKTKFKYVSYYRHDCDDPVIVVFDRKQDAMKDALEALEESLADCRDPEADSGARAELRKKGTASIDDGEAVFGVFRCEYCSADRNG